MSQLFPATFTERLCELLLQPLKKLLEASIFTHKGKNFFSVAKTGENEQKIVTILGIYCQLPAATPKFIDPLCRLVLQTEKSLLVKIYRRNFILYK